jgi:hypothetical protein
MNRGIYLVANKKSQEMCENLIFSIRKSGCNLPIRLIHFGGKEINSTYIMNQVEFMRYEDFPDEAKQLIVNIQTVLPKNLPGLLYRYLAWYSDWDEFIYSDNDVVALCNWDHLFDYLNDYDFVHADEEYKTNGRFDYHKPEMLKNIFGQDCLESALTSGHIIVKKNSQMIIDINSAVEWFKENPDIPKKNDQAFMHIASLIGKWNKMNLCKPPHNWLSPWAGDYVNMLQLIQEIQLGNARISHMHYSGSNPKGDKAVQELLFSANDDDKRLKRLSSAGLKYFSGYDNFMHQCVRVKRFCKKIFS